MSEMNTPAHQLPAGTQLSDKYEIIRTIGEGGFGITYMGRNTVLDIPVAIKEYYPNGFANRSSAYDLMVTITDNTKNSYFSKWKEKFLNEARILAKFSNIPNIVNVLDFFEQNGTAYIVMEYLNGVTLSNYVSSNGVFSADKLCRMMIPMLKSLDRIHQEKLIHRDISPDNIMVMSDGTLKLYDFGAARDYSGTSQKSLSVMLKPGFAPEEQYRSRGIQGPWTDVYAVCATMYYCITGIKPDDSIQRAFLDELKSPSELGIRIPPPIETAILMGMSIKAEDRFRTAEALATALERALSISEHTPQQKSPVKFFHQRSKANEKINSRDARTEIVSTKLEESAENRVKKAGPPGKKSIFEANIIKIVVIGIVSLPAAGLIIPFIMAMFIIIFEHPFRNSSTVHNNSSSPDSWLTNASDYDNDYDNAGNSITLHGTWNGTTYISDYLGVKCSLDKDWVIASDAELASDFGGSDMSEESIRTALDSYGSVLVMNASSGNKNINIVIEDTKTINTLPDDAYFQIKLVVAEKSFYDMFGVNPEVTEADMSFCGESTRSIAVAFNTDISSCYQLQIPVFKDDYIIDITFSSSNPGDIEDLVSLFSKTDEPSTDSEAIILEAPVEAPAPKSLRGTWDEDTYISDFFGFKCQLDSNWYIMTDEDLEVVFGSLDMPAQGAETALNSRQSSVVMGAVKMNDSASVGNVSIVVLDTEITDTPTGDLYFAFEPTIIKKQLEETNGGNVYVSVINVDFCGENVRGLSAAVEKDYAISYQIQVPVFKGKYLASILYSTSSQQEAEDFIKRFSKV